ncbi:membrane protein [Mycobacterium tuberculosis]|nr:membrane protein [Mycobacterium tuberculosis]
MSRVLALRRGRGGVTFGLPGRLGCLGAGEPGWLWAEAGLSALTGLAPALLSTKAMTMATAIPTTTTAMPRASPLRRQ